MYTVCEFLLYGTGTYQYLHNMLFFLQKLKYQSYMRRLDHLISTFFAGSCCLCTVALRLVELKKKISCSLHVQLWR